MTVAELRAAEAIAQIPRALGDLNQSLVRIAAAIERQNFLMNQSMGLCAIPTVPTAPADHTTPSPAPSAMPSEVDSFTGEPLTR